MTRSISTEVSSTAGPSTAERIKSACARSEDAVLAIPGTDPVPVAIHHLRACGDAVVVVSTDSIATALAWQSGNGGMPAVLELTDRAPLLLREPVRSLVWLRGTVRAVAPHVERVLAVELAENKLHPALLDIGHTATLLWLRLDSAVVADSIGADSVDAEALRQAQQDPFCEVETAWLEHLDDDHADVVELLARKLPPALRRGRVRPLAIDRYGLSLRVEGPDEDRDVRLPFAEPVDDIDALSKAVRLLVGCPFLNGLRSRS